MSKSWVCLNLRNYHIAYTKETSTLLVWFSDFWHQRFHCHPPRLYNISNKATGWDQRVYELDSSEKVWLNVDVLYGISDYRVNMLKNDHTEKSPVIAKIISGRLNCLAGLQYSAGHLNSLIQNVQQCRSPISDMSGIFGKESLAPYEEKRGSKRGFFFVSAPP